MAYRVPGCRLFGLGYRLDRQCLEFGIAGVDCVTMARFGKDEDREVNLNMDRGLHRW